MKIDKQKSSDSIELSRVKNIVYKTRGGQYA